MNSSDMVKSQEDVTASITAILANIVQDWDLELDGEVSAQSYLVGDLNFSSVDFVELAVAIEEQYKGVDLEFDQLIMVNGRRVEDISVEQVASFVFSKLKDN